METKGPFGKVEEKNNSIKNFCWPLDGKENEECIQNYEDVFEGGTAKQSEMKAGAGLKGPSG